MVWTLIARSLMESRRPLTEVDSCLIASFIRLVLVFAQLRLSR